MALERSAWDARLMCRWTSAEVLTSRRLQINLPEFNCTDMHGAVEFSKAILPMVREVIVIVGDRPDILYKRQGRKWEAFDLRHLNLVLR